MSIAPPNSPSFMPSSDAVGYILYPPASPDFPALPSIFDTPGSAPDAPTTVPHWVNPPAPGVSPSPIEPSISKPVPIPVPRATPFPADYAKFEPGSKPPVKNPDGSLNYCW